MESLFPLRFSSVSISPLGIPVSSHSIEMRSPSEFQRKVFNTLAILGLSQVQISKQRDGSYRIESSDCWKRILYYILRLNSVCKLVYLVLLSLGCFQAEFEFFEKMAILLWFLIFALVTISERIFYKKYPFFEILTAWWRVEESVHKRLGHPDKLCRDLKFIAVWRVWFQGIIATVGILAMIAQYDAAPKYCVFVYSLFEHENDTLKWIAGVHEVVFLVHAWLVYGSVIYLSSVIGAEFTYIMEALQAVLDAFINYGCNSMAMAYNYRHARRRPHESKKFSVSRKRSSDFSTHEDQDYDYRDEEEESLISLSRVEYDPIGLLKEYLHVHMIVTQLNRFAAYNFLYMHGCSYVQMVSDVFQMIQILRSDEADFLAVMFFAEDMMVCMYMLFRCFKSMAFLQPSSVSFLEKYRALLATRHVRKTDRALMTKMKPTLHTTAFKLGPCLVGPWTVGTAMDVLLQYYICVALWK